jgi:hypothetical protein
MVTCGVHSITASGKSRRVDFQFNGHITISPFFRIWIRVGLKIEILWEAIDPKAVVHDRNIKRLVPSKAAVPLLRMSLAPAQEQLLV